MENFNINFESEDIQLLKTLKDKLSQIKEKNKIRLLKSEPLFNLDNEIELIHKKGSFPSEETKDERRKLFTIYEEYNNDYLNDFNNWNLEMHKIIKKYNYIKLSDFLKSNPLPETGSVVEHKFAHNLYTLARTSIIPILNYLYTSDPKFINTYPEKWLKSVYLEVKKIDNEPLNLMDLNL